MRSVDVLISGGGPAGSNAARLLSQQGYEVVLLEKQAEPWPKPCGGYLPVKTLPLLPTGLVEAVAALPVRHVELVNARTRESLALDAGETVGQVVERIKFDEELRRAAESAGTQLMRGDSLVSLHRGRSYTMATTVTGLRFKARYVLAADGVQGTTGKLLNQRRALRRLMLAVSYVARIEWHEQPSAWDNERFMLYCCPVFGGFGWAFPVPGGANIGVAGSIVARRQIESAYGGLKAYLGERYNSYTIKDERIWPLPAGGFPYTLAIQNALFVGDAAGMVDSFSGEGIFYALRSGQLAAEAIGTNFSRPELVGRHYRSSCTHHILPCLRRSLGLSILLGSARESYFEALVRQPELTEHLLHCMKAQDAHQRWWTKVLRAQWAARFAGRIRS